MNLVEHSFGSEQETMPLTSEQQLPHQLAAREVGMHINYRPVPIGFSSAFSRDDLVGNEDACLARRKLKTCMHVLAFGI